MNTLIISDLHLTENPHEAYRWKIFQLAREFLLKNKQDTLNNLFILGDLLDKKDRHPAELVNHLIHELLECSKISLVTILKGNHDYLKPEHPFLDFVKHLPNITWIDQPCRTTQEQYNILWLPHSRTPETDWANLDYSNLDLIFMHQSVIGCKVSNMYEMNHGLNLNFLTSRTNAKIFSGDIHVPQDINALTYIGTPHPVSFGDDYQPRMVWLENPTQWESIPIESLQRLTLTVSSVEELQRKFSKKEIKTGDHVKVKVRLTNQQLSQWSEIKNTIKEWCRFKDVLLFNIALEKEETNEIVEATQSQFRKTQPQDAFVQYCAQEQIDPYLVEIGQKLLNSVIKSA